MNEMSGIAYNRDEDDHLESELHATEDELGAEDELADDEADELEDMPVADEPAADMISLGDFVQALEQAVEDVTGQPTDADLEGGEEEEMAVDAEVDIDGGDEMDIAAMEVEEELPLEEEKDWGHGKHEYKRSKDPKTGRESKTGEGPDGHYKDYEGPSGGNKGDESKTHPGRKDYEKKEEGLRSQEALVAEVARRVAARLQAETKREEMVDHLAERILTRLTRK